MSDRSVQNYLQRYLTSLDSCTYLRMAATKPGMKGTKRTRNGKEKLEKTAAQGTQHTDTTTGESTPPAAQPPASAVASAHLDSGSNESSRKKQKRDTRGLQSRPAQPPAAAIPPHHPAKHIKRQKLPKLPPSKTPITCLFTCTNAFRRRRNIQTPNPPPCRTNTLLLLRLPKDPLHNRLHSLHTRHKTNPKITL